MSVILEQEEVVTGAQDIERKAPEIEGRKTPRAHAIRGSGERYSSPTIFEHVMINFLLKIYSLRSFLYVANTHQYNLQ